ncbi:hypothetical protein AVEN_167097-1 [Araneus ventricosus]|uniref:RNase H type-1 domain-containing protein n=1 Tax=Araneus ventricosus TaxID=182803 RepID=A0A4Y2Q1X2_ARAVE|nr:hypothetical protein AVEN_199822-1 [Araneus ventricosus]GBN57292.1 hypothetical protein AVEN_91619-1 [Araneus ventricosus]GBO02129.1 hypothetical protein AVEN_222023-1 [Araneus ventricosus]GBO02136.1 hypothetical protein AVEN_167097-1 [Araneus ventricosus]
MVVIEIFKFKLSKNNTVYQAELAAINFAVRWTQENGFKINIYTNSQSSIEALRSTRPRPAFVVEAKKNFYLAGYSVELTWVKAHAGDPGNELADHHAKLATADGENMNVQTPLSCVKFKITKNLMKDWQYNWEKYDSDSEKRARSFVPCVNKKITGPQQMHNLLFNGTRSTPLLPAQIQKTKLTTLPLWSTW